MKDRCIFNDGKYCQRGEGFNTIRCHDCADYISARKRYNEKLLLQLKEKRDGLTKQITGILQDIADA